MGKHEELRAQMASFPVGKGCIKALKESINCENNIAADTQLEEWLSLCVKSLFYQPNHRILVLIGQKPDETEEFLWKLSPFGTTIQGLQQKEELYEDFIWCNSGLCDWNKYKKIAYGDQFRIKEKVFDGYTEHEPEKRLINLCGTTIFYSFNWAAHIYTLKVKSINFELYNSIDKKELWGELYNKYKLK